MYSYRTYQLTLKFTHYSITDIVFVDSLIMKWKGSVSNLSDWVIILKSIVKKIVIVAS